MSYSAIDPIIRAWAHANGLKMFVEFAGRPSRFCYVSSDDECFQVSIEPPTKSEVAINAWSVDTADDAELHCAWVTATDAIESSLDAALRKIEEWKVRPRATG